MGYSTGTSGGSGGTTGDAVTNEQLAAILGTALGTAPDLGARIDGIVSSINGIPGTIRFGSLADVIEPNSAPPRGGGEFVPDGAGNYVYLSYAILNDPVAYAAWKNGTNTGVVVTTAALPGATQGVAYTSPALTAVGGTAPYTWSFVSGGTDSTHVAGMALNASTGVISGTPNANGTFTLVVRATDSAGSPAHGDRTITLVVAATAAAFAFSPGTPTDPQVGVAYVDDTLAAGATGGTAPYTFTATGLANNILLDSTGSVTGVRGRLYTASGRPPSAAGTLNLVVTATDSAGSPASINASVTVRIDPPAATPPHITTSSLPNATKSSAYAGATMAASGGQTPFVWSVVGGAFPTGITMNSSGVISGTPSVAGDFSVTIQVSDANSLTDQQSFTITVVNSGDALAFPSVPTIPSATTGTDFDSGSLIPNSVSGGVGNKVFTSSSLPNNKIRIDGDGSVTGVAGRLYSQTVAWGGVHVPPDTAVSSMTVQVTVIDSSKANVNDGVTNGSNVVSSASITPDSTWIGKAVYCPGVPVGATVTGVGTHSLTLSAAATASASGLHLVVGDFIAHSGSMSIVASFAGQQLDISDLISDPTTRLYLYGAKAGLAVDPNYNVSQINSRATTAKGQSPQGRLISTRGTSSSRVRIELGTAAGAASMGHLVNINAGPVDWSQLKVVEFFLAPNQPANASRADSAHGSNGDIFFFQNCDGLSLGLVVNGNAANQPKFVPGKNDNGLVYNGISAWYCTSGITWDVEVYNCRGTTGSSDINSTPGSTTVTAASNGVNVSTFAGSGVLNVASTAALASVNGVSSTPTKSQVKITTGAGTAVVSYTGKTGTTLTGCTLVSGSGTLATGQTVRGDPHDGQSETFHTVEHQCSGGSTGQMIVKQNDGTGFGQQFTLSGVSAVRAFGTANLSFNDHGIYTGQGFKFTNIGSLVGVDTSTTYYAIQNGHNSIVPATTRANAVAGIAYTGITGSNSTVAIQTIAGSQEAASGTVVHYANGGRSTPRSVLRVIAWGTRHGSGTYCGGNVTWDTGSEAIGCSRGLAFEAGDPGAGSGTVEPTGDAIIGSASGATHGQIYTARNVLGIVTCNGNNHTNTAQQVKSCHVYGWYSAYDTEASQQSGFGCDVRAELHNAQLVNPLSYGHHFAASGTTEADEASTFFITGCTIHKDAGFTGSTDIQGSYNSAHGVFTHV